MTEEITVRDDGPRFVKVYAWTIDDPRLEAADLGLLAILMGFADWDTGRTMVGLERLSEAAGMHVRTLRRRLDRLEVAGAIVRDARKGQTSQITIVSRTGVRTKSGGDPGQKVQGSADKKYQGVRTKSAPYLDTPDIPPDGSISPVQRNPHWDALVEIFGHPPVNQRTLFGRMTQQAKETGPPHIIGERANIYMQAFSGAALTPTAFLKHWDYLGSPAAAASALSPKERRIAKDNPEARKAELARLLTERKAMTDTELLEQ